MTVVIFSGRPMGGNHGQGAEMQLAQVPRIGEYIFIGPGKLYKVEAVLYAPANSNATPYPPKVFAYLDPDGRPDFVP